MTQQRNRRVWSEIGYPEVRDDNCATPLRAMLEKCIERSESRGDCGFSSPSPVTIPSNPLLSSLAGLSLKSLTLNAFSHTIQK